RVYVVAPGRTLRLSSFCKCSGDGAPTLHRRALDRYRSCAAMMGAVAEIQIVLEANECRQHVVPRPAIASRTSPAIIVVWCPAHCARRVDLRRGAETQPAQV